MASVGARVGRLGRRAVTVAEHERHRRLGQQQHGHRGRDDERQHGTPARRRCGPRTPSGCPVDHFSARSGATTDMTVTATTP